MAQSEVALPLAAEGAQTVVTAGALAVGAGILMSRDNAETIRGRTRENEAAQTLAKNGYDVEQRPKVPGGKEPDYRIEGEIFDCYSPEYGKPVRGIGSVIERKVQKGQADRIVLNLYAVRMIVNLLDTVPTRAFLETKYAELCFFNRANMYI